MDPKHIEYCLLGHHWWPVCMTKSDWASWVQAVGTIVAIFAAILVGWYQARRSEETAAAAIRHNEALMAAQRIDRIEALFAAPIAVAIAAEKELRSIAKARMHPVMTATASRVEHLHRTRDRQQLRERLLVQQVRNLSPITMPSTASFEAVQEVVAIFHEAREHLKTMPTPAKMVGYIHAQRSPNTLMDGQERQSVEDFEAAMQNLLGAAEKLKAEEQRLCKLDRA